MNTSLCFTLYQLNMLVPLSDFDDDSDVEMDDYINQRNHTEGLNHLVYCGLCQPVI